MSDETDEEVTPEDLLRVARARRNEHNWGILVEWVDDLSDRDADAYQQVEPELLEALTEWPDELRVVPAHWWRVFAEGNLPWGWELCRALVPPPSAELGQDDVFDHITHLDISQMPTTPGAEVLGEEIALFPALTYLDVSSTGIYSVNILSMSENLRTLQARECHRLERLDALADTSITDLCLSPLSPEHATGIGASTRLEFLEVDHGQWHGTLEHLSAMTALKMLSFDRVGGLHALDGIETLPSLQILYITDTSDLVSIKALRGNTSITQLSLSGCRRLRDLTPLETMPNLEHVCVDNGPKDRDDSVLDRLTGVTVRR